MSDGGSEQNRVDTLRTPSAAAKLQFGTEVVTAANGSLAAVLGALPGASTSVNIMIGVLEKAFSRQLPGWTDKLRELVPLYGRSIANDAELCREVRAETAATLRITSPAIA